MNIINQAKNLKSDIETDAYWHGAEDTNDGDKVHSVAYYLAYAVIERIVHALKSIYCEATNHKYRLTDSNEHDMQYMGVECTRCGKEHGRYL